MRHQRQPNHFSCLPTAFANLLDVPVQEVLDHCGHDGSEKVFQPIPLNSDGNYNPRYLDTTQRRSFHIQEMINFCLYKNVLVIPVEAHPVSNNGYQDYILPPTTTLKNLLPRFNGVLIGEINKNRHAVTLWQNMIYDPNGQIYSVGKFAIDIFYLAYTI